MRSQFFYVVSVFKHRRAKRVFLQKTLLICCLLFFDVFGIKLYFSLLIDRYRQQSSIDFEHGEMNTIQTDGGNGEKLPSGQMVNPEDKNNNNNNNNDNSNDTEEKVVALTFDDGPHSRYTKQLLDGLRKRNVKATFFVVGCNMEGKEELIRQMAEDGHLIGNHTYHHVQLTKLGIERAREEIEKTNELIESIIGQPVEYIRPPFGSWNDEIGYFSRGMTVVLWNVDPYDWKTKDARLIANRILKDVKNCSIILLHDIYESSVEAAFLVIDELQKQGYEFVTVNDLSVD